MRSIDDFAVISPDEAEARFAVSKHIAYDYGDYADDQEQRVYDGGLEVKGNLTDDAHEGLTPNLIVDGDLVVDGSIDWMGADSGAYLIVTGNLRCRNLIVAGAVFLVLGDAVVEGTIVGLASDADVCAITVRGTTKAKLVAGRSFPMHFGQRPQAMVAGDAENYSFCDEDADEFAVDVEEGALADRLVDDVLEDGELNGFALRQALLAGRPVLR
jgi:hypothetical protein